MKNEITKNQMARLEVALNHLNKLHEIITNEKDLNVFRNTIRSLTERAYLSTHNAKDRLNKGWVK